MVIYLANGLNIHEHYVRQRDAMNAAREHNEKTGEECIVEQLRLVRLTRDTIVSVLNGWGGHVAETTIVQTFPPKEGVRNDND